MQSSFEIHNVEHPPRVVRTPRGVASTEAGRTAELGLPGDHIASASANAEAAQPPTYLSRMRDFGRYFGNVRAVRAMLAMWQRLPSLTARNPEATQNAASVADEAGRRFALEQYQGMQTMVRSVRERFSQDGNPVAILTTARREIVRREIQELATQLHDFLVATETPEGNRLIHDYTGRISILAALLREPNNRLIRSFVNRQERGVLERLTDDIDRHEADIALLVHEAIRDNIGIAHDAYERFPTELPWELARRYSANGPQATQGAGLAQETAGFHIPITPGLHGPAMTQISPFDFGAIFNDPATPQAQTIGMLEQLLTSQSPLVRYGLDYLMNELNRMQAELAAGNVSFVQEQFASIQRFVQAIAPSRNVRTTTDALVERLMSFTPEQREAELARISAEVQERQELQNALERMFMPLPQSALDRVARGSAN